MQCLLHRHLESGAEDLRELVLQPVVVRKDQSQGAVESLLPRKCKVILC